MDEKDIIRYFDFTVNSLSGPFESFSINNILFDELEPKSTSEREKFLDLCDSIKTFGVDHGYIKFIGKPANNSGYFKLTEKGIELKKFGKGHNRFQKISKKEPLTKYQKIYLSLFIVFGIITSYGVIKNLGNQDKDIESQKEYIEKNKNLRFKLYNQSEYKLENVTIGLPDTVLIYPYLDRQTQTNWTYVKSAYHYGFVRFFDTKGNKYFIQPVDYVGEKAFENGDLIFIVKSIDSVNKIFELDFDYKNK